MSLLSSTTVSISKPYSAEFPNVAFFGRSLAEYAGFFDLTASDLAGRRIFDCGAGFASFAGEARRHGAEVMAADPLYGRTPAALAALGAAEITTVMRTVRAHAEKFQFTFFRDFEHAEGCRRDALARFLEDYPGGFANGRYLRAELPQLPLADQSFDLALNSHFLFLYARRYGEDFLMVSLRELTRVAREVRVYPLVDLDGRDYAKEPELIRRLLGPKLQFEIRPVAYAFLKGADAMLRIYRDS